MKGGLAIKTAKAHQGIQRAAQVLRILRHTGEGDRAQAVLHDPHNLDLHLDWGRPAKGSTYQLEACVYFPGAVPLAIYDKQKLLGDFEVRSKFVFSGEAAGGGDPLRAAQENLLALLRGERIQGGEEILRSYGGQLGDYLRSQMFKHRQALMAIHSLHSPLRSPHRALVSLRRSLQETVQFHRPVREMDSTPAELVSKRILLERYIHQCIVDSLADFEDYLSEFRTSVKEPARFEVGWKDLDRALENLRKEELHWIQQHNEWHPSALLERSHLKKYFQSVAYVEVEQKSTLRKFTEPVAALGAAMAALVSGTVEYAGTGGAWATGGAQGVALIAGGVALYTLKDRLKDQLRNLALSKMERLVPDREAKLSRGQKIVGAAKDWLVKTDSTGVSKEMKLQRQNACTSEAEMHLKEPVLKFRRLISINKKLEAGNDQRGYHEILRIGFERFLKYLDDPQKTLRRLDENGNIQKTSSHRVYHFHLGVVASTVDQGIQHKTEHFFRIIVDKNGLQQVETLLAPQNFPIIGK